MSGVTSAAIIGGSMGMQAMGAYSSSQAQKAGMKYQAQIAANNATIAQEQASIAIQDGQRQEQTQDLKTGQIYGAQRAAMAANGVDLGEGSANEVLTTTKFMGNRDALTIRDNAMRQAWGYDVQSQNFLDSSAADKAVGDSINPMMSAATSLLGSAASASSTWYAAQKAGSK